MSQENVGIVREVHEALTAGDEVALLKLLDPEVVWIQNPNAPDPRTFYGHDGIRQLAEMVAEALDDVRLEADRFVDGGESVVALGFMRARGKGSGVEMRGGTRLGVVAPWREGRPPPDVHHAVRRPRSRGPVGARRSR